MNSRKFKTALLLLGFTLPVCPLIASEAKDMLELARNQIRDLYPGYIRTLYQTEVESYFYRRSEDFLQTAIQLRSQIEKDRALLKSWLESPVTSSNDPIKLDSQRIQTETLRLRMTQIQQDYAILQRAWSARCNNESLESAIDRLHPARKYQLINQGLKVQPLPWAVTVQYSASLDGANTKIGADYSGNATQQGAAVGTVAGTTIGYIIGSMGGPAGAAAAGQVGSIIGSIVGGSIGFVSDFFGRKDDEENQIKLIQEISQIQEREIQQLERQANSTVLAACEKILSDDPRDPLSVSKMFEQYTLHVNQTLHEVSEYQNHLETHYKQFIDHYSSDIARLTEQSNQQIRKNYFDKLEQKYEEFKKIDMAALKFQNKSIIELSRIEAGFQGPASKADLLQRMWEIQIEGDSRFSELSSQFTRAEFEGPLVWKIYSKRLQGELQK